MKGSLPMIKSMTGFGRCRTVLDVYKRQLVSGYAWVTNDAVNLLSGIAVVVLGLLVALP